MYNRMGCDKAKTMAALQSAWKPEGDAVPPHTAEYAAEWEKHLLATGGCADSARSGRPPKVSHDEAARAAALLIDGVTTRVLTPDGQIIQTRYGFTSFAEARCEIPELQQLMEARDCTADQLLAAMKKARPDLVYALQRVKIALSPDNIANRQARARALAQRTPEFWSQVVFVDETKMYVLGDSPTDVHIWRSKLATDKASVLHVGGWGQDPVAIHVYAAVNAQLGFVAYQFTTGTTKLGKEWPRVKFQGIKDIDWDDVGYMVCGAGGWNQTQPCVSMQRVACVRHCSRLLRKNQGSSTRPRATAGPGL